MSLNSWQIRDALIEMKFQGRDSDKAYAIRLKRDDVENPLYIKRGRDESRPVEKNPLVIHPDYKKYRSELESIEGCTFDFDGYKNTNLDDFPQADEGARGTRYGIAVQLKDKASLSRLIDWLSKKTFIEQSESKVIGSNLHSKNLISKKGCLPVNTILFGPPGTGKTYSTTRKAVELCDGVIPEVNDEQLRHRFNELRQEGRITFVTFHQSYGYEEFVEGLRPVANEGQVSYEVLPGAFKRACHSAKLRGQISPGISGEPLRERTIYKMSLGATWNQEGTTVFDYCIQNNCVLLGWGSDVDFSECSDKASIVSKLQADSPAIEKLTSQANFLDRFKHDIAVGDLIFVSLGNKFFRAVGEVTGEYEFAEDAPFHQMRKVRWLAVFAGGRPAADLYKKEVVMSSLYKLNPEAINYEKLERLLTEQAQEDPLRPHVLIIDEINRANISKVFGELITLIEPDKREGQANAVTVKLPYSGEDFSVPANLHLLGTMNTADRSIALLDTALRRRFEFEEVMPNADLLKDCVVEGVNLGELLESLNQRVEVLYDRDHTIGHAYFMGVNTLEQLERVFRLKVLPLLQEYFYENWSQVRRVLLDLGPGDFVQRTERLSVPADGVDHGMTEDISYTYKVNPNPFPISAFKRIYGAVV